MKKRISILLALMMLAVLAMPLAGVVAEQKPISLKLGHQAPDGTAYDDLAKTFKKYVEERTNGKYVIDVYSGGQLGGDRELMEALQFGNVHFNVLTASDMGTFAPEMEVQDLPYLFENWEQVYKFLDSDAAKEFYALSDPVGIKTLSFMPRGFRHVTHGTKSITSLADIKGEKLRVAESKIYEETFKAFGASPQIMAWGEVYTALQQGTVNGMENTIVTMRDYSMSDVQKYCALTYHMFAFAAITVNPDFYNSLPAEEQAIFLQAAIDAGKDVGAIQEENEKAARAELEAKGMVFVELTDMPAWVEAVKPVWDEYFKTHNKAYFDAIQASYK